MISTRNENKGIEGTTGDVTDIGKIINNQLNANNI